MTQKEQTEMDKYNRIKIHNNEKLVKMSVFK